MHINEARLVVVDVETTGLDPKDSRVIEIAAVAVSNGEVQDTFTSLIDPQCPLPRTIQRLTGIRPSDLDHAPVAGDVMPAFVEFLGDSIFVAHNVRFDWNMVHGELHRLRQPDLSNPKLCTVRLARRLLRELPSKSLGHLVKFYGLDTSGLHRASKDAHMTAMILERLLKRLQATHDISDVEAVLRFQNQPYAKMQRQKQSLARIKQAVLPKIPAGPGIYIMQDKFGKIIYVGRSRNLKQRVRSYFAGIESHPPQTRKLVRAVRDVRWQTTATELQAILLESNQIKEHKPAYNRAAIEYARRPSLRLGTIQSALWVTVVHYVRDDGAAYYGPFGSQMEAETIAAILVQIYGAAPASTRLSNRIAGVGLTAARIGGRLEEDGFELAKAFLVGDREDILHKLDARMRMASARQKYELAGQYRNWHMFVEALSLPDAFNRRSILDRHGAALFNSGEQFELHLFAQGRPVRTLVVPTGEPLPSGAASALYDAVAAPRERLSRRHINEVALFAHWLRQVADTVRLVWLDAETTRADFEGAIGKALAEIPPDN